MTPPPPTQQSGSAPVARAVAVSATAQLAARGFDVLANVAVSLAILRHLGPKHYGEFVVVSTLVGLVGLIAELGLPKLAVREVARDGEVAGAVIGTITVLRVGLTFLAAGLAQLALFALHADAELRVATLIASSMILAESLLSVVVVFHVALRQQYEAFVRLAANFLKLACVAVLVKAGSGLVPLVAATSATLLAAPVLAWLLARRRFDLHPYWARDRVRSLLRDALPVWPAMLAGVLYLKLDALMVALLATRSDTGIYGAAYQPIEYVLLASVVILNVLFPLIARAHGRAPARFVQIYRRGTEILLAAVLPVAVILLFTSNDLVRTAYDSKFAGAATPMAVLGVALVFLALNAWQGLVLLAADLQRINVVYLGIAVVFNVALDCVLIPHVGPVGAAIGTLVSGVALVAMSTFAVAHFAGTALHVLGIARVLGAGGSIAVLLAGLRAVGVHWALGALAALVAYPLALLGFRVFRLRDLSVLRRREGDAEATLDLIAAESRDVAGEHFAVEGAS